MSKLKLVDIDKSYRTGDSYLRVLNKISLEFRESEFVSILGPSGSGKTTLLNMIGGLDHYDSGDLIINNESTKHFRDKDWDSYRNRSIGFVFQNYNLIGHQSVLQNVEISMTLSGISADERKERATEALKEVGLEDHINKKPNQLSGGQMQRVAIARALVNNPDIILADEPTGALDSKTSTQVMDILREVAKTRLVIMVTHNEEIALEYSTRIIRFLDGEIQSDSHPLSEEKNNAPVIKNKKNKRTSMSMTTALSLSFKNLLTKKGRTILTAFAGSIGIIGVALVLALSNGLTEELDVVQGETLSNFPIMIDTNEQLADLTQAGPPGTQTNSDGWTAFPDTEEIFTYNVSDSLQLHKNVLTDEFIAHVEAMDDALPEAVDSVSYRQGIGVNLLTEGEEGVIKFDTTAQQQNQGFGPPMTGSSHWQEMPTNQDFVLDVYDLIGEGARLPERDDEILLVVDEYNRLSTSFFEKLGLNSDDAYVLTDFIGREVLKVVSNNDFYVEEGPIYREVAPTRFEEIYQSDTGKTLTITGILRLKEGEESGIFDEGFIYTRALTDFLLADAADSDIAKAQEQADVNILTNQAFQDDADKETMLIYLGAISRPVGIDIYPTNFEAKDDIKAYLDEYNADLPEEDQIIYNDLAELIGNIMTDLINTVTYVLVGFAAISLVVSTIMIGIITYVSVIERTKEIGILRSVGARKKDISRVFNAETLIVGFISGALGVGLSYLLIIPINQLIERVTDSANVASLTPTAAIILIVGSMLLTLVAGVIPSRMAAKKDPVVALRTE